MPLVFLSALTACSSMPERATQPTGKSQPVNSLATEEMLAHTAGLVVIGAQRNNEQSKRQALSGGVYLKESKRQLFRNKPQTDYAQVPGARLIERIVHVPFEFASATFSPTPEQSFHIRQLLAVADRIEIRGRTDGKGKHIANERIAHHRAEAAKRYLLSRGVPPSIIAINYQAAGDYIDDNETVAGRNRNRRVELEFYIVDLSTGKAVDYVANAAHQCSQPIAIDQWQQVGADACIKEWGTR